MKSELKACGAGTQPSSLTLQPPNCSRAFAFKSVCEHAALRRYMSVALHHYEAKVDEMIETFSVGLLRRPGGVRV